VLGFKELPVNFDLTPTGAPFFDYLFANSVL